MVRGDTTARVALLNSCGQDAALNLRVSCMTSRHHAACGSHCPCTWAKRLVIQANFTHAYDKHCAERRMRCQEVLVHIQTREAVLTRNDASGNSTLGHPGWRTAYKHPSHGFNRLAKSLLSNNNHLDSDAYPPADE